jgi:hypothetical protein
MARKDMGRRTQETDIILLAGSAGEFSRGLSTGPCEGSGDGYLSPYGPC